MNKRPEPSRPQLVYAQALQWVSIIGLLLVAICFLLSLSGLLPSTVTIEEISGSWSLSSDEYTERLSLTTGWDWVGYIFHANIISFASIVVLALGSIVCLVAVLFSLIKAKDTPYTVIVIMQILVLLFAASGIIQSGGH